MEKILLYLFAFVSSQCKNTGYLILIFAFDKGTCGKYKFQSFYSFLSIVFVCSDLVWCHQEPRDEDEGEPANKNGLHHPEEITLIRLDGKIKRVIHCLPRKII